MKIKIDQSDLNLAEEFEYFQITYITARKHIKIGDLEDIQLNQQSLENFKRRVKLEREEGY